MMVDVLQDVETDAPNPVRGAGRAATAASRKGRAAKGEASPESAPPASAMPLAAAKEPAPAGPSAAAKTTRRKTAVAKPSGPARIVFGRERRARFLELLRQDPNVSAAAREVGVARATAYSLRTRDAAFAAAWDDAVQEAVDHVEAELRRRAVEGVEEPVFYQGKEIARVRKYSDQLLKFYLQANRERYRDGPGDAAGEAPVPGLVMQLNLGGGG